MQFGYASSLLYIISLYFSKLAVLVLIKAITPVKRDKRVVHILAAAISVWAIVALFATSFQCSLPETWNYVGGDCFNRVSIFHSSYEILYLGTHILCSERGGTTLKSLTLSVMPH